MLDGYSSQQVFRQSLLRSIPELRRHGQLRKDQYIRHYPDRSGLELTVGVTQSRFDVRLVLKDEAMVQHRDAEPLIHAVAGELEGTIERADSDRRVTFWVHPSRSDFDECSASVWIALALDRLLKVREALAK